MACSVIRIPQEWRRVVRIKYGGCGHLCVRESNVFLKGFQISDCQPGSLLGWESGTRRQEHLVPSTTH